MAAGSKHVRTAWRKQVAWLRSRPALVGALVAIGVGAGLPTLLMPYGMRMFVLGALLPIVLVAAWWFSLVSTGSYRLYVGALAEDFTSETLGALRRVGWRIFDGVEFADFDVDHVAVGPGGVLAVETKWTDKRWDVDARRRDRWLDDAIVQARIGARRIDSFLRSSGLDIPVVPVLILWGPCVVDIEGGSRVVDGAVVLAGRQEGLWRSELEKDHVDQWSLDAAAEALEAYQVAHAAAARRTSASTRSA